jgi:hypothetical protein
MKGKKELIDELTRYNYRKGFRNGRKDTLREVLWKIPRIKTFDELITWLKIEICYYGNKEAKIKEVEK